MADDILTTLMIPVMDVASDRMVHSDGKERLNYWNAFKVGSLVFFMPPAMRPIFCGMPLVISPSHHDNAALVLC